MPRHGVRKGQSKVTKRNQNRVIGPTRKRHVSQNNVVPNEKPTTHQSKPLWFPKTANGSPDLKTSPFFHLKQSERKERKEKGFGARVFRVRVRD